MQNLLHAALRALEDFAGNALLKSKHIEELPFLGLNFADGSSSKDVTLDTKSAEELGRTANHIPKDGLVTFLPGNRERGAFEASPVPPHSNFHI